MATFKDVLNAVTHVQASTGNSTAWQAGLSPAEVNIVLVPLNGFGATAGQLDTILAKIHQRHPLLFGSTAGAPTTPSLPTPPDATPPADEQQSGTAVEAMKNAEAALVQLNSDSAEFDRQMLEAIVTAHKTTDEGIRRLDQLEKEIENAVKTRNLDTALGAREFQRYLIGKLQDILAVVAEANDSDESKKALLAALAALYAAQGVQGDPGQPGPSAAGPDEASAAPPAAALDPYLDELPDADAGALGAAAPAPVSASTPTAPPAFPSIGGPAAPSGGALPTGGLPGDLPLSGLLGGSDRERPRDLDDAIPDDLMADEEALPDEPVDPQTDDDAAPPESAPAAGPTTVTLPNGETVTAASPQLAAAIKASAEGTPIADAFRQQGITIPPPGTAVADPIEPSRAVAGDIGMFTDRHALALGNSNALLDGQIQRIANVSGPSFLGWQHPPAPATTTAPTTTDPAPAEAPTPTRPSATVVT